MKENDFNQKMFGISCDLGVDDESCTVGYTVDMGGNIKIDWIKYDKEKEVKKLKYFEMKVVKVKKEEQKYFTTQKIDGKLYGFYYNKKYKMDVRIEEIKKKPKGNWVNGENLDKIKFPVPCSYKSHTGKKHYALLLKDRDNGGYKYKLLRLSQDNGESMFLSSDSLKKLIRKWDIHILKGKIIIFDDDMEDKYSDD